MSLALPFLVIHSFIAFILNQLISAATAGADGQRRVDQLLFLDSRLGTRSR